MIRAIVTSRRAPAATTSGGREGAATPGSTRGTGVLAFFQMRKLMGPRSARKEYSGTASGGSFAEPDGERFAGPRVQEVRLADPRTSQRRDRRGVVGELAAVEVELAGEVPVGLVVHEHPALGLLEEQIGDSLDEVSLRIPEEERGL